MEDLIAKEGIQIYQDAKNKRSVWDSRFQEVVDFVRPNADSFTGKRSPGAEAYNQIYDATAVDALEEFSSGLHSFLTNPTDLWFSLRPINPAYSYDRPIKAWCEEVTRKIYHYYSSASSGHSQAMSEGFLDIGSFGTAVVHQYWSAGLKFKTFALADCWIKENNDRKVDTLIRRVDWTARQIYQEFGEAGLPPRFVEAAKGKPDKPFQIIHLVFPKSDSMFLKNIRPDMPWASLWVCVDTQETLKLGGYDNFCYHVPRWVKMSTEVYGRSPALKAMPDIKVLNRIEFQLLKGLSKAVDPPLVVPSEAFLVPLKTSPGAINYMEPNNGQETVGTLPPIDFRYPETKADQKREAIRKMFYNDFLRMEKENVEMTAYEVQDRREEKLRLLAPMLGRQESELLGPMISLSYMLLMKHGEIDPPPRDIAGGLKIEYTSPAARAQTGMRAFSMDRYIQRLIPIEQIRPGTMDIVDTDAYARELAEAMGTTTKILKTPEAIQQQRDAQSQQQQMAAAAQTAEPASKAIKNLADAGVSPSALMGG